MKTFTCKEIMNDESGCDMEFSGDEAMDVASQCGKHVAGSTDDAHKPMRDLMTNPNHTQEDREKWFKWFQGEWDKKKDK
jgi:hypothetical protein